MNRFSICNLIEKYEKLIRICILVGISKAAHTTHDTEDVVVDSEDLDNTCSSTILCQATKVVEAENSVINAREVAGAARLVFFGVKSK